MSRKVAIVSDSTTGLTDEMLDANDIHTSYSIIIFDTDSYREFKDIDSEKFLELSNAQKELPTTS